MPNLAVSMPWSKRAGVAALALGLAMVLPTSGLAQQPTPAPGAAAKSGDPQIQVLLDRIDELERRLSQLESTAVLSAPKVLVKEVHVWVDEQGNQYDHEVPGSKEVITYERELAQRRETIEDSIGEALEAEAAGRV